MYVLLGIFIAVFAVCAVIIIDYIVDVVREKNDHKNDFGAIGSILDDTSNTAEPIWTRPVPGGNSTSSSFNTNETTKIPQDSDTGSTSPSDDVTTENNTSSSDTPSDSSSVSPSDTTEKLPSDNTTSPDTDEATTPADTTAKDTPPEETDPPEDPVYSDKFLQVRNALLALNAQYPDIIGYIYIPSLGVKYPLVHRPEDTTNTYYLTHNEKGQEQKAGSIYADYRCDRNLMNNENFVIYGHNMRSGSMFGSLSKLIINEEIFKQTEVIIVTFDGIYTYKVFSAYRTTAYESYCSMYFKDDDAFEHFLDEIVRKSAHKSDIGELTTADRIITLSTCTNITETGRYAIHGVLVKIER